MRSVNILMEGVPEGLDFSEINAALQDMEHVEEVHDLHIWSLSSNQPALSAHIKISSECSDTNHWSRCLEEAKDMLEKEFGIKHTTVQVEPIYFEDKNHCG